MLRVHLQKKDNAFFKCKSCSNTYRLKNMVDGITCFHCSMTKDDVMYNMDYRE